MSFLYENLLALTWQQVTMWVIGGILIYLAIAKEMEPSLLLPIGFGAILVNMPFSGAVNQYINGILQEGPLTSLYEAGIANELFPLLLFIGIGAMCDFGPLLSNPVLMIFGAAAQFGIFFTFCIGSMFFPVKAAASIATIVAADGHPETVEQDAVQDGSAIKPAPKIFKETCEIGWTKSAKEVYDFVRGLSPYPGAWTTLIAPDGKETVLKIYQARKTGRQGLGSGTVSRDGKSLYISAADELVELVELQLAGKKRMSASDFLNGMKQIEAYRAK